MSSTLAHQELELLQKGLPSSYWAERWSDPTLITDWETLALAPTAWAWLQQLPSFQGRDTSEVPTFQKLWNTVANWRIELEDVPYVDYAIQAWSDQPVWSASSVSHLVHRLEAVVHRPWHHAITSHEPRTFEYHLLNTLCSNVDHFPLVSVESLWNTVGQSTSLRDIQRELLFLALLKCPSDRFPWPDSLSSPWYKNLQENLPHLAPWFERMETIQSTLDLESTRALLVEQWTMKNTNTAWVKQMDAYKGFDLGDLANLSM